MTKKNKKLLNQNLATNQNKRKAKKLNKKKKQAIQKVKQLKEYNIDYLTTVSMLIILFFTIIILFILLNKVYHNNPIMIQKENIKKLEEIQRKNFANLANN